MTITDPDLGPAAMARGLGARPTARPLHPGHIAVGSSPTGRCWWCDNCEHLLDPSAALVVGVARSCPRLTLSTTSRETIGVAGEADLGVPSLPLADKAIELFVDRAGRARPDFVVTDENAEMVAEICRRLDGGPWRSNWRPHGCAR